MEEPRNGLRFVLRGGKRILQQRWVTNRYNGPAFEWVDVPLVEETESYNVPYGGKNE